MIRRTRTAQVKNPHAGAQAQLSRQQRYEIQPI